MTEHVRTVHEGKKRIYKEVNCQVKEFYCLSLRIIDSFPWILK